MSDPNYIAKLLKHSDAMDVGELQRTLQIARYAKSRKAIRQACAASDLEQVHKTWRALDTWRNSAVHLQESPWLREWEHLESTVDKARELAVEAERFETESAVIILMLWEMVAMPSDPKWVTRMCNEAEAAHFSYLTWQLMAVRQACKRALLMLEFKAEFDVVTQRF